MAMDNAKHLGIIIADGMPPPGKLKKAMAKDEGESDLEAQGESDSGEDGGGKDALKSMMAMMKDGDADGAWDAFCDAVDIAKGRGGKPEESGKPDDSGY